MSSGDEPAKLITELVNNLNGKRTREAAVDPVERAAYQKRLLEYAKTWLVSGYDLNTWSMRDLLQEEIRTMTSFLYARPDGQPYLLAVLGGPAEVEAPAPANYVAADDPAQGGGPADQGHDQQLQEEGQSRASETFVEFITGPHYDRIGQCARCKNWFFNGSGKKTRYCSVKCAKLETSNEVKKATREREFERKLQKIELAIKEFDRLPKAERAAESVKPKGWKGWVARKAGRGITTNFITRVVNAKQCDPPQGII